MNVIPRPPFQLERMSRRCGFRLGGNSLTGSSRQILKHCLVGGSQPSRHKVPAEPRKQTKLEFMAYDDSAQAIGGRAECESALRVHTNTVCNDCETTRSIATHHGATQSDRVCLPTERRPWGRTSSWTTN